MSANFDIIEQLFASAHTEKSMRAIEKLFAPGFTYTNQIQGELSFDAYCQYIGSLSFNYQLTVEKIEKHYDIFVVNYYFDIIDNQNNMHSKLPAVAKIFIEADLIASIDTTYSGPPENLDYMRKYTPKFGETDSNLD